MVNPSFEDIYPINEDALYEDFYDALVLVVYKIENLLENDVSTSSVWELTCTLQKFCALGMPKPGILNDRQQRAWKNILEKVDRYYVLCDFQAEQSAREDNTSKKPLNGLFYCSEKQRYINNKLFSNWKEHKDFIKYHFKEILPELKAIQKMLVKPEKPAKTKPKKRGRKKDPKVKRRNKEIAKYQAKNPRKSYKEIGKKFNVSAEVIRKACNSSDN
ncbi:MAG: hypothetical protein PHQ00_06830 [Phycisphaerae bacterium]|nr:hypothetical protein [Phycisphaerae bacterium]